MKLFQHWNPGRDSKSAKGFYGTTLLLVILATQTPYLPVSNNSQKKTGFNTSKNKRHQCGISKLLCVTATCTSMCWPYYTTTCQFLRVTSGTGWLMIVVCLSALCRILLINNVYYETVLKMFWLVTVIHGLIVQSHVQRIDCFHCALSLICPVI